MPEPLWWLLGAIVSFYFGARELHHQRSRTLPKPAAGLAATGPLPRPATMAEAPAKPSAPAIDPDHNAAVEEWRRLPR